MKRVLRSAEDDDATDTETRGRLPPPRPAMASGADAAAAGVAALGISGAGAGDEWAEACPPLRRNLRLLAPDEVSAWCVRAHTRLLPASPCSPAALLFCSDAALEWR